jgi:hypothetical protein
VVVRGARWGRAPVQERRRGELVRGCEARDSPGVIRVAFIGTGERRQGSGEGRLNGWSNGGGVNGNFKRL